MLHFSRWKIALILIVCIGSVVLSLPNFMSRETLERMPAWFPTHKVSLGLDLRGGSHLLMEVDFDAYLREQLGNLTDDIRTKLRAQKIGYRDLSAHDGKVTFSVREDSLSADVEKVLRSIDSDLTIEKNGPQVSVSFGEAWQKTRKSLVLEQAREIVERRVNETGTREPVIQRQGENRILLQVPGLENPEHLKELLGRTAKMTFHLLDPSATPHDVESGVVPPRNADCAGRRQRRPWPQIRHILQGRAFRRHAGRCARQS